MTRDTIGNMDRYVVCKLECNYKECWLKFTQPVLLQSYSNEFKLGTKKVSNMPGDPEQVLMPCKEGNGLLEHLQKKYRSGTCRMLHMMQWSWPEIINLVCILSRIMKTASQAHLQAMYRLMKYCVSTPNRGLILKPEGIWDGNSNHKFEVKGKLDAAYATNTTNCRSLTCYLVFLNGAPVSQKSGQQKSVTLSTAKSELVTGTQCAQDMLYILCVVLESIGLRMKKPIIVEIGSNGAVVLVDGPTTLKLGNISYES
jgi:hypothetical protein